MRFLLGLVLILLLAAGGAYVAAGRMSGPPIQINKPEKILGASTPLEVEVQAPGAHLEDLRIVLEQNGKQFPLFTLADQKGAEVRQNGADRLVVSREIGKQAVPELQSGSATVVVTAARKVLYGIRTIESTARRDLKVRLERPRVSIVSTHHYVNHGGSEVVVYRATPEDVTSGVLVGEVEYPGYPATGASLDGVRMTDPALRVAFFALLHDQDLKTPIRLFARDEAGNTARGDFDYRVFPKPFRRSRIEVTDTLIDRVVPAILEGTTEVRPEGDNLAKFLVINGELRRKNNDKIASLAAQTRPELLWKGLVFHPFGKTAVESAFADHRTYDYKGKEVDQQVHLGFDLASYAGTPIVAANRGIVLFAEELGIYGNCVIIDHGMGVQSLYGHLSTIDVKAGQTVEREQQIGRSGMTGMAGGDHLHFTMLVNGKMVNPVEWWDAHWIEDRILRKLRGAGVGS
jgi:murein DD-endopeptidase MepM/ murein hydrolase activator NlpD